MYIDCKRMGGASSPFGNEEKSLILPEIEPLSFLYSYLFLGLTRQKFLYVYLHSCREFLLNPVCACIDDSMSLGMCDPESLINYGSVLNWQIFMTGSLNVIQLLIQANQIKSPLVTN
jgi:hypothetical protein